MGRPVWTPSPEGGTPARGEVNPPAVVGGPGEEALGESGREQDRDPRTLPPGAPVACAAPPRRPSALLTAGLCSVAVTSPGPRAHAQSARAQSVPGGPGRVLGGHREQRRPSGPWSQPAGREEGGRAERRGAGGGDTWCPGSCPFLSPRPAPPRPHFAAQSLPCTARPGGRLGLGHLRMGTRGQAAQQPGGTYRTEPLVGPRPRQQTPKENHPLETTWAIFNVRGAPP